MSVTLTYKKFGLIPISTTWFNSETSVDSYDLSTIHIFRQSTAEMATDKITCIQQNIFYTSIIDLEQPQEELWKACAPKSCRYEIRKIQKLVDNGEDVQVKCNSDIDRYVRIANDYIKVKKYSKPLKRWLLQMYIDNNCGSLVGVYYRGQLIGGNFYVTDHVDRTRLLYSFNDRFCDKGIEKLSGAFMRYLHWYAMIEIFKKQKFRWYDMGGVVLDKQSPIYGITNFKLSFGGTVKEELDYVLTSNRFVGVLYKFYRSILR